jgi:ubiquitin-conjugating enzyme E2 J2
MSSQLTLRRIMKEFENLRKNPNPNILALPMPSNIFNWHFLIFGLKDSPFEGGFYHGKLILPSEYP